MNSDHSVPESIAIIGLAGRFPQARNVAQYWRNLCEGKECISFFTDDELRAAGAEVAPEDPSFIKARAMLEDAEWFDAAFFGINPTEAEVMDPQHRIFLECAWEALEDAGYTPDQVNGPVGVFAGMSPNSYLPVNLMSRPDVTSLAGPISVNLGNDKDYLPLRVSYKLNLRGPSLNVQTTCSTSLMTAALACQQLLTFQCDVALAGGVSLSFPQRRGYRYQEGSIFSPDGHCRAFDAGAMGTVSGEGAGIVVLKRLSDALADGDQVYAVIKGFGINNDGAQKIGFTAPSVEGQAEVIAMAQAMAGVSPESISYIEAHGTGTPLGDPIEIEALSKAFRRGTEARQFCAIGSVKTNIGHLDVASGIAGLIKLALALRHRQIPPSLHFQSPNSKIDFANSPFFVNTQLRDWEPRQGMRRAGISSFGFGGTNVHLVLEEAPAAPAASTTQEPQLLVLSARSAQALNQATTNLANHLRIHPELNLADVATTLQTGRRAFPHRRTVVCQDVTSAAEALSALDPRRVFTYAVPPEKSPLVFMFPGQGAQELNMGKELYQKEPEFRKHVDRCAEILQPILGCDIRSVIFATNTSEEARRQLNQTRFAQPALFMTEYALARLWQSWGIQPEALIGHSVGEYVAATLAGVFSMEEAVKLVAHRARLVQELPGGSMLAVRLTERDVEPLLNGTFSLAAVNSPSLCVISGPTVEVQELQSRLSGRGIASRLLAASHAFHSAMMDPVIRPFTELVRKARPQAPQMQIASTVTGTWLTPEQATDPAYWAKHLRQTVRFTNALDTLLEESGAVLLEVGPGQTLGTLARQRSDKKSSVTVISSLARGRESDGDIAAIDQALGQLWLHGASVDWTKFQAGKSIRRVSLPTYPFERKRFWVEPGQTASVPHVAAASGTRLESACTATGGGEKVASEISTPETNAEGRTLQAVRQLLSSLSGMDLMPVSDSTTFLEFGFDSLFLVQASNAIEKRFGVKVAFRQLMGEFSTLRALAGHIDSLVSPQPGVEEKPAATLSTGNAPGSASQTVDIISAPLTEAQREIWFACQISEGASCAYNESRVLHFRGELRLDALRSAVQSLLNRHEALRATMHPGGEYQQIHSAMPLEMPLLDYSNLPREQWEEQLAIGEKEEASQPFDLVNGPLLRARLLRLAGDYHVLFLTVHHIICDGGGWVILLEELGKLYGNESGLPEKPLQLSDYALDQARKVGTPEWTAAEAFWQREFSEIPPVLELPTDGVRPASWKFEGARETAVIEAPLSQSIKKLGAQQGCTLFTTVLAAWSLFLHRLCNQDDLVIGIPVADRVMERSETLVGHCVNFLPVRLPVSARQSFVELLGLVRQKFLEAFDHRFMAFGALVQKLALPRDAGRMPLVAVTFNVDRMEQGLAFAGLQTEVRNNRHSSANFDLSLNVTEEAGRLHVDCRYNRSMFTAQTIRRWLHHFETVLQGIAQNPQAVVATVPLLSPEERQEILFARNETRTVYPKAMCLHQLFEHQAERTPHAIAVEFNGNSLTYDALNRRANRLARRLQATQVKADVPVGLCLDRSLDLMVSVLAVMKAGGACVPLDPTYPSERLALMIANARVPVLLTQAAQLKALPAELSSVAVIDVSALEQDAGGADVVTSDVTSDNLAYVLHTSGSTGSPKGVAMPHRPLVNLMEWQRQRSKAGQGSRTLQFASLNFDVSFQEIFSTWSTGGTLVLMEDTLRRDAAGLLQLLKEKRVNRLFLPFVALRQLAEVMTARGVVPEDLHEVITAGEALQITPALVAMFQELRECTLENQYGPTESHVVTAYRLSGPPASWPALPSIGRPIANAKVYLLDANAQPVPTGIPGELFISGDCLARGYLHQRELTAERFVESPFETGARLYRTGDVARWLPDGELEYLGRSDQQVKIRGHRVEPAEVEATLCRHPSVKASVVVALADAGAGKSLAAYVVADPDQAALTPADLRAFLHQTLPEPLIPSTFTFLEKFPLTPSGKVNRRALPAPDASHMEPATPFVAPRTPTEEALAAIWCEVLEVRSVGVQDNFFDLGGHSLLMTRVILRASEAFQVDLPLRRFFESPTIEGLAVAIEELVIEQIQQSGASPVGEPCAQGIS